MLDRILDLIEEGIEPYDALENLYNRVRSFRITKAGLDNHVDIELIWDSVVGAANSVVDAGIFSKTAMNAMLRSERNKAADLSEAIGLINEKDDEDDDELLRINTVLAEAEAANRYTLDEDY